jgi:hypothetical protein
MKLGWYAVTPDTIVIGGQVAVEQGGDGVFSPLDMHMAPPGVGQDTTGQSVLVSIPVGCKRFAVAMWSEDSLRVPFTVTVKEVEGTRGEPAIKRSPPSAMTLEGRFTAKGRLSITYAVPRPSTVTFTLYSLLGREVAHYRTAFRTPGRYRTHFRLGAEAANAAYIMTMRAAGTSKAVRIVLR